MNSLSIALPPHFSVTTFLDFHGRDQHAISEKVEDRVLNKAITLDSQPCLLTMDFNQLGQVCTASNTLTGPPLSRQAQAMLGLNQPIETFEQAMAERTPLSSLVHKQRGLRVPQSATPFEALSWAIIGQQISVSAATAIRRRFIQLASPEEIGGLCCYPDAAAVSLLDASALRSVGFSASKADTLLAVSRRCCAATRRFALRHGCTGSGACPTGHSRAGALERELHPATRLWLSGWQSAWGRGSTESTGAITWLERTPYSESHPGLAR